MFAIALALVAVSYLLPGHLLPAMAIAAIAATACGLLVHRYIEAPLIDWLKPRRKMVRRRGDVAV